MRSRREIEEARAKSKAAREAKSELEKLFSGSKVSQSQKSEREAIQAARGTPRYFELLTESFEKKGVPLDWDLKMLFLDHRDPKIVVQVLKELQKTAPLEGLAKQGLLAARLKVLALSTFDPELTDEIRKLQKALMSA